MQISHGWAGPWAWWRGHRGLVWPPPSCQVACPRNNCQREETSQAIPVFLVTWANFFSVLLTVVFPVFTHFWNVVYYSISTQLAPNCLKEMHPALKESHEDGWTWRMLGAGHVIANQRLITLSSYWRRGWASPRPPPLRGGKYFSKMIIFQRWISFRSEYF